MVCDRIEIVEVTVEFLVPGVIVSNVFTRCRFPDSHHQICYNLFRVKGMAVSKQKIISKEKEIEKRLAAVEAARVTREKLSKSHGFFGEINNLIREVREGKTSYND